MSDVENTVSVEGQTKFSELNSNDKAVRFLNVWEANAKKGNGQNDIAKELGIDAKQVAQLASKYRQKPWYLPLTQLQKGRKADVDSLVETIAKARGVSVETIQAEREQRIAEHAETETGESQTAETGEQQETTQAAE